MRIAVLTASDRCAAGLTEDKSGPLLCELLKAEGAEIAAYEVSPDDKETIMAALMRFADEVEADVVFTTGGTGFSPRDVTPEATKAVCDREVPGIPEAVRAESLKITPRAMLSRAAAGIRGRTLIVNLPGSPKAVRESLAVVLPILGHAVETLSGRTLSCAAPEK